MLQHECQPFRRACQTFQLELEGRQLELARFQCELGMEHHSNVTAMEIGLRRVGEVLLGCITGLVITWLMSKLWPVRTGSWPQVGAKQA